MLKRRTWLTALAVLAGLGVISGGASACIDDATILIDRALNSPTLTVRYSGAAAAVVELRVNGISFGKRAVNAGKKEGETSFTIDLSALNDGDNTLEVLLIDKTGRILGKEQSTISTDEGTRGPVYLMGPKVGATVQGPIEIKVGFGKELKNAYVSFFIDNQFRSMSNYPPYSYVWDTARETNGWHEIEAWVVDDSSTTYKTRKVKVFINNPGGNTTRRVPVKPAEPIIVEPRKPEDPPLRPESSKVEATPVEKPITPSAPKIKAPLENLTAMANRVAPPLGKESRPRTLTAGVSNLELGAEPKNIAPAVRMAGVIAANPVRLFVHGARDLKGKAPEAGIATGQKLLTPTGTRNMSAAALPVAPKPQEEKPVRPATPAALVSSPEMPLPLPRVPAKLEKSASKKSGETLPVLPNPKVEPPKAAEVAPTRITTAKTSSRNPGDRLVIEAKTLAAISVSRGTRLPEGTFTIRFGSEDLNFDVQPYVEEGIPFTPFRHLFEHAGGEVKWNEVSKEVLALGQGREIYLKIAAATATVNKIPVELEVAPFILRGRTIVPLSFIREALHVEVDYDPNTRHVLITKVKS